MNSFDTDILLLEIEALFQRFRDLPLNTRVLILEKIRVKLLEEFKDFIIQENDGIQNTVIEIPCSSQDDANVKSATYNEISASIQEYSILPAVTSKDGDFNSFIQPTMFEQPANAVTANTNDTAVVHVTKTKPTRTNKNVSLCYFCGKQFRRKNIFNSHIHEHENNCTYECATCSVLFNVKEDLIKHVKTHSKKTDFSCPVCNKKLVNNRTLKNHYRVIHAKDEKFTCVKCDYFAYSKHTLKEHHRVKHEKRFTRYACVICNKIYNSRVLLKVHMRSHVDHRPYNCLKCGAAFVSSGQLTNHTNSVHGEQKFCCEVCSKSFKTIHKLKRHSFIHTRVKPFACPFCTNYASNTQGNLTKHVKTVHQMNDFSYLKYKKMTRGELEEVKDEWLSNAQSFTNEYLQQLASEGITHNIDQLKQNQLQKNNKPCGSSNTYGVNDLVQIGAVFFQSS